ncbi:hypothetical protein F5B21DRAFT_525186 [Xylaria acuta]|nr:hypothetical protein F5B21DRAFT_525186 [Xylaria acuta]
MNSELGANTNPTDQYPIHTGTWINWSRGQVLGATLTLERQDANLLIAFTAFFIAFVATRTWRILCFAFHRASSTSDPQDAIYHQSQAILRNSFNPEEGIHLFLSLLWKNRCLKKKYLRPLSMVIVAITCVATFTIAGGFSSRISTAVGTEVLISSANCGYLDLDPGAYFITLPFLAKRVENAANYAQQCYSNNNFGLLDCGRFVTKRLTSNRQADIKATCPFSNNMCRDRSKNLRLDTGYIDSHDDLGLNTPTDQRIVWRNVFHCAPLVTTGFTTRDNTSMQNATLYHYGNFSSGAGLLDYMYVAESVESQYTTPGVVSNANYRLDVMRTLVMNGTTINDLSDFIPIDSIARDDADINLYFLSGNEVRFIQFTQDKWYRLDPTAYEFGVVGAGNTSADQAYIPLEPASPLGCADQYQFCSTAYQGNSGCGPLASFQDAVAGAAPFFNTTYDTYATTSAETETYARFQYFADTVYLLNSRVSGVISFLGPRSLLSQSNLLNGFQGPIAPNQWQLDVMHWQDISLTAIQQAFLGTAFGPTDPEILRSHRSYNTTELKKLCNSQKIRSTAYASFSLFGLYFTLVLGFLVVLTSYLLEPVSSWLHKRKYHQYAHLEWITNATLQLQRLAHEEIRSGTWSECTETVPVTKANEFLGCLDITDLTHPILCSPGETGVLGQTQTGDESPDANLGGDVPQTVNTPLESPGSSVSVRSDTGDISANFVVDEDDPSPHEDRVTTDAEITPSGDQQLAPPEHRIQNDGHA